jgi:hypothetical protein
MFVSNEHHLMGNRVHAMDLKTKVLGSIRGWIRYCPGS